MDDLSPDQFMEGVSDRAGKVQDLIPAVMTVNELILWTSALLRTSAELVQCAGFDRPAVVKIFEDYLEQVEQLAKDGVYTQERIH
jgi:hypothetical protein